MTKIQIHFLKLFFLILFNNNFVMRRRAEYMEMSVRIWVDYLPSERAPTVTSLHDVSGPSPFNAPLWVLSEGGEGLD